MYRFRYNINFKGNNQIIVNINNIRHHSTNKLTNLFYSIFGDDMKKIIPYILAILFGAGIGVLVFDRNLPTSIKHKEINATGFQVGVFTTIDAAKTYRNKYPNAIIVADDDVYRVFYSILTDNTVIEKMRNYLNTQKISYFEKDITVSDKGLITALNDYESVMKEASTKTFKSINDLILESYGEKI